MAYRKESFEISCPHEADHQKNTKKSFPNYHPLTSEEIRQLLDFAKEHKNDAVLVSKAQIRLEQGIPGTVCPHAISGCAAKRSGKLSAVFVHSYELGGIPPLVALMEYIMNEY